MIAQTIDLTLPTARYAKCIEVSKRVRWDIDRDVIRGRTFDFAQTFLPEGIAKLDSFATLGDRERRLLSQIQGRTYANMLGLAERFIGVQLLELSRDHWLGDQVALEALVRFTDEELKHQQLFRRIDRMIAAGMPAGYRFIAEPNEVADFVLDKSTWSVLALTCHNELSTQMHYRQSIEPDARLSELYKDVFFFHWQEESQHTIIDELEWRREDGKLYETERDMAVSDLIALFAGIDGLLQMQAQADAAYFVAICGRGISDMEAQTLQDNVLRAYRWQYLVSGVENIDFATILGKFTTPSQRQRIARALLPIME